MKMGFGKRKVYIKMIDFLRHVRDTYHYFSDFIYENSFKKGKIKTLLTIQEGAVGDTYNFIGILNEFSRKYPAVKIYCLTRESTKHFYKNPKFSIISSKTAKEMIKGKKFDGLVSYGSIGNFFKKSHIFNIPYRAGRLFSFKAKKVPDEILPIFNKLGFEIHTLRFYYTNESKETSKKFYEKNKLKKPIIFLHVGSGKTIKSLKEGKTPSTMWPNKNWVKLSNYLIEKYNCSLVFTGVKEEKELVNGVINGIKHKENVLNIAGKYSIEEITYIVQQGDLVVGVDSGAMHIFSQIGIPMIILFSVNPKISSPHSKTINLWSPKTCHSCRRPSCPEHNPVCIKSIKVEEVINNIPLKC